MPREGCGKGEKLGCARGKLGLGRAQQLWEGKRCCGRGGAAILEEKVCFFRRSEGLRGERGGLGGGKVESGEGRSCFAEQKVALGRGKLLGGQKSRFSWRRKVGIWGWEVASGEGKMVFCRREFALGEEKPHWGGQKLHFGDKRHFVRREKFLF